MRKSLEDLANKIDYIGGDNIYQAISDLKQVLYEILHQLDIALPKEVEPD